MRVLRFTHLKPFGVSTNQAKKTLDRVYFGFRETTYADKAPPIRVAGHKVAGAFTGLLLNAVATDGADVGKPTYDTGGVLNTNNERYNGNYYNFKEFQAAAGVPATYQLNFNGSFVPQFKASSEQLLSISRNSVPTIDMAMGQYPVSIMSLDQYKKNFFVGCVRLCLPNAEEQHELSGADSRGISLNAYLTTTGLTTGKNVFIVCETTSTLRIGAGRAIEIIA